MSSRPDRRGPAPRGGPDRAVAASAPGNLFAAARNPLVVGALTAAATAYVAIVDPNHPGHYVACPLLTLTGYYCPWCGGLRAVHDLTHLDVAGAWGMNPLLVLALPAVVVAWVRWLTRWISPSGAVGRRASTFASTRRSARIAWAVLVVVLVYGVARNIPVLARWLAPVLAS